jgi:hypothetical protein
MSSRGPRSGPRSPRTRPRHAAARRDEQSTDAQARTITHRGSSEQSSSHQKSCRLLRAACPHHAVRMGDWNRGFVGRFESRGEPYDWLDGLPTRAVGQTCAFCSSGAVRWVHALDPNLVRYRVYGKGHTLPTFWTLCDRCEQLYIAGDSASAVAVMMSTDEWACRITGDDDIDECVRQPLDVFARADLGAREFAV